ncbi:MAG: neuromedin U [Candidatus Abyssobacteria bacterium SURF_17]|uniref:Neuromedin U n=1 Tax=Candidatus Abyssobacteria bacterium SURF_17 TaxID=2093361 RepID=A0A419ESC3_9BACT|nr:MAG: neuromedin U [Candidatus Abyssubacteria bacterium SURF_17]
MAEGDESELAKKTQNPVSDLISVPFQNNWNFDVGPIERTQYVLNIQPVWPISLNDDWNLITRTIVPVISQPAFFHEAPPGLPSSVPDDHRTTGLGDINFSAFFSPAKPSKLIWGIGPTFLLPTATDDALGSEQWGAGPAAVALTIQGPWVYGALVNNIWSFAGDDDREDVNTFLLQPFVNYNLPKGWYLSSAPIITANWEADDSDDRWTTPVGGGFGKILRIGKLPVNLQLQAFYNVEKPEFGADWQLRFQVQFLFPK